MPAITLTSLPIVFERANFKHYAGDNVRILTTYARRNPRREFYQAKLYTAPYKHSAENVENVLLTFPEAAHGRDAEFARRLSALYNVECEPVTQRLVDMKYYAGLVGMPLVVWLEDGLYYYLNRGGHRRRFPVRGLK